jgi:TonB family protein
MNLRRTIALAALVLALVLARPAAAQTSSPADSAAVLAPGEVEVDRLPELLHPEVMPRLVAQAYPQSLRRQGVEGNVTLRMVIDTDGRVRPGSLRVLSATNPGFIEAARWVAHRLPFRPATAGDIPVAAPVTLVVVFVITDR